MKIGFPPAEHCRVEREHQRGIAGGFRSPDHAADHLVAAPRVELEPSRSVADDARDLLECHRRDRAQREWHAHRRRRACGRALTLRVDDALHADRRQEERGGRAGAEDGRTEVAITDLERDAWPDAVPVERLAIGAHGVLAARSIGDIRVGERVHLGARAVLRVFVRNGRRDSPGEGSENTWTCTSPPIVAMVDHGAR